MAGCCGGASSVVIVGGDNTIVSGSGTVSDPYVISGNLEVVLQAKDSNTIQLELTGTGNTDDPFVLTATSLVSVNDLVDVIDPTPPILNDTLLFDGTNWTYGPAASVPAGSINVGPGIEGDGTIGDPISIRVSETIDTSTSGLYTYIDSAGELRAEVPSVGTVAWTSVTGKPTTFPPDRPLTADSVVNGFTPTLTSVAGIHIFVGPTAPTTAVENDIWFETP
jgi:hypothetical protein